MKPESGRVRLGLVVAAARNFARTAGHGSPPPASLDVLDKINQLPQWLEKAKRYSRAPHADLNQAADWLLDNDYQISRAIREIRTDMPTEFYRRLNTIQTGEKAALPRIFVLAHRILKAAKLQLTVPVLIEFLDAYQETEQLTTAELWALPSMLRLAALEILGSGFADLDPSLAPPFASSNEAAVTKSKNPTDRISRAITILIAVRAIEWRDVVDHTSCVEAKLRTDPAGVYSYMDFATRDRYRNAVEQIAYRAGKPEIDIAEAALDLSRSAHGNPREQHVGYWLTDSGRVALETRINCPVPIGERLRRWSLANAGTLYATTLLLLTAAGLALPLSYIAASEAGLHTLLAGGLLSLLPATVLSVAILHWLITRLTSPRLLPMMDFRKGIPADCPTCVAVPIVVMRIEDIPRFVEQLDIRYLSNPDPMLRYVMLADYADAPTETMADDKAVRASLTDAIKTLNKRYGSESDGPFFLLHRPRRHNVAEGCWMGWERKRGKLEQFNEFLLGGSSSAFEFHEGDIERLVGTRFVITLDADTVLPPDSAARLVGTLAHPLNQAMIDPQSRKAIAGYTIIQPRLEVLPLKGSISLFCRLFAGDSAIDIYSRAVSDVYQDLFGTGIFVGKGIYDVAAFQQCLDGRVPENRILSHDLFEGLYGRTALASNIVLYEEFPDTYVEHAMRLHRWVRGDWQLLAWLMPTVPGPNGKSVPNILSGLDRWKIVDNLRRSLLAPALLLFFIGGWMLLPGSAWFWTTMAVLAPGAYLVGELYLVVTGEIRRGFIGDLTLRLSEKLGRWFLAIVFLISDTRISLDAISRSLWRMGISGKHLLEWRSAAHVSADIQSDSARATTWRMMWPSTAIAIFLAVDLAIYDSPDLLPATPILGLWLIAPEIAIWLGRLRTPRRDSLNHSDRVFLKQIARRTWLYFETFAGPEDNWLPPDNYQEKPNNEVAHRTSPTNIGLFLTSAQAAHDFGFIGASDFSSRINNALSSIDRLEHFRGHLLNWYDTRTLAPLEPRYVSTVDSGNLAVCLVALRHGSQEAASGPAIRADIWDGLACTFDLLIQSVRSLHGISDTVLDLCEADFRRALADATQSSSRWIQILDDIAERLWPALEKHLGESVANSPEIAEAKITEVHVWNERVNHHIRALSRELETFVPWLRVLADAPQEMETVVSELVDALPATLAMASLGEHKKRMIAIVDKACEALGTSDAQRRWLARIKAAATKGLAAQEGLRNDLQSLASKAGKAADAMDFTMLYDPEVRLFRIGYDVSSGRLDPNHYDLLATEARLASFFAIAKHDAPVEHWYALGRPVTRLGGKPAVLSWNGSMFEYLMAPIFLPGHRGTLLGESEAVAVAYQRAYARKRGVPWGISESAFATTDPYGNYQYRAFGTPGLGLRRGLTDDLVIAPYASALALCCWPNAAVHNMREMETLGALGLYGFHDALDYTPERVVEGRTHTVVRNYMAHHHGMSIAAISNVINDDIFVRRVLVDKRMQTIEPLLQERIPWEVPIEKGRIDEEQPAFDKEPTAVALSPWMPSRAATIPQLHMIGNGRMATWISEAGAGCLWREGFALTRWLADPTTEASGYWIYIRDADSGETWSVGRIPAGGDGTDARVVFHQHMVEFFRRDHGIAVRMEASVSPADDADIREMTITNESEKRRRINFTSYAEVVLAPPLDDERHPAFSKLFVGSRYLPEHNGLFFERRPRRPEMKPPVLLHRLSSEDASIAVTGYETDRARFLGRHGDPRDPAALRNDLTETTGWTLDPVMCLQTEISLEPMETKRFSFVTIAGDSRGEVLEVAGLYASSGNEQTRRDAGRAAAREIARLDIDPAHLPELQVLASLLQTPHPSLREVPAGTEANRSSQPDLWQFGISGDFPILLLRIEGEMPSHLLELLIKAQRLWRRAGMNMDLVVLRQEAAGYEAPLRERILAILRDTDAYASLGTAAGIHLLSSATVVGGMNQRLCAAAHIVLHDDSEPLAAKLDRILEQQTLPPQFARSVATQKGLSRDLVRMEELVFDNGIGGFDADNGDYVIHLDAGEYTPAPWCNVLANDNFGTIVSESGIGFTWAVNSGENRLTPFPNDPVCDVPGEALFLRDEQSGEIWSTTPMPIGDDHACRIRHAAGWTSWEKSSHGLHQTLRVFVPDDDPVKLATIRLANESGEPRRITITYYAEWLLGALASRAKPHIVCEYDAASQTILANNSWNPDFSNRVAFLASTSPPHSVTGSRYDFLGSEGNTRNPAGLGHWDLGGRFIAGGDACAAYQVHVEMEPGETVEVSFVLGQGGSRAESIELARKWSDPNTIESALQDITVKWAERLGAVQVKTPDPAFDLMVNRWLLYQTMTSRLMARAGYYQAGGAFGFRDQLQDVLALLMVEPQRARKQILLAASRQFEEGDVQHWWHPPSGRGVRTRISDDYIWLVYVTARYIEATGDDAILDEEVQFLSAPVLRPEEMERYSLFEDGPSASILEHCERALDRMMETGEHGLPLMGTGDWNDGMDRVGDEGRGESVWLAWFQIAVVNRFAPIVKRRGDERRADEMAAYARALGKSIDANAWDGAWFVRAFDDEGEPWGSSVNEECQIDAIAQSWAVLAGCDDMERAELAMGSARKRLVDFDRRLVQLLDPPFHATPRDPGYIKAYPAGVRENGGQYTHAAAWMGHAFAGLGNGEDAWSVFDIINPIRRTQTGAGARHYLREPYVLSGDVYGPDHIAGLGGWSWYTGASGWTWQLGVEAILGIGLRKGALTVDPCLPRDWGGAEATITGPRGTIHVKVEDPQHLGRGERLFIVDGKERKSKRPIAFPGKGKTRRITVRLRREAS